MAAGDDKRNIALVAHCGRPLWGQLLPLFPGWESGPDRAQRQLPSVYKGPLDENLIDGSAVTVKNGKLPGEGRPIIF